ncbi:MAG: PLP-dependent transferase [Geminicoccaceae bacterium]
MQDGDGRTAAGTILAHDGSFAEGAVVPPIYQTSLFTFPTYQAAMRTFAGEEKRSVYSRVGNPTVTEFETKLAALEGAEAARGFASGMAAISGAVLALVESGDRIVCVNHVYPDAYRFFEAFLPRFGVRTDYVDGSNLDVLARALPGARLLYLESPTSWTFEVQDLAAIAALARAHGVITVIDNSWATPIFQQPLLHGIDLVLHSASKYLGGHSDVVAGVVAGRRDLMDRIGGSSVPWLGAKLAPFEGWLLVRGLRTLEARVLMHERQGLAVARWLAGRPEVSRVLHPTLDGRVDGRQLKGSTGLFSIELRPDLVIERFVDALRLFKLGVSWGGHESLVFPAEITLKQVGGPNSARAFGVSPRTVRLHVGLERVADLTADLQQALTAASG